jgi:preprotein translocase subunit Sss1
MSTHQTNSPFGEGDEQRLWDYIDGLSSPSDSSVIEKLLEANAEWQAKYSELLEVHQLIQSSELEEPSLRFTKNVMEEITRLQIAPATSTYINKNVIRGIGIFFITIIVGFIIYGFGQLNIDWSSKNDSVLTVDLNKVNFSRFFNNTWINAFMIVNIVAGLFLLDRYLANKRKKFRNDV